MPSDDETPVIASTSAAATASPIYIPPANLPPPKPLLMDENLASNWKAWKKSWCRYEIATGIYKQETVVRVSTLLSVIGEDATKAFDTFQWEEGENEEDAKQVLAKFDAYCEPRTQVIYERYRFNNRKQETGENISAYLTELRTIAKNCKHEEITPDEILRDRIVLGIRDDKVRERLLRYNELTLQKAVDLVKAAEQTEHQVKLMRGGESSVVNALRKHHAKMPINDKRKSPKWSPQAAQQQRQVSRTDCGACGRQHGKRECPAFGQKCRKCGKMNHFQAQCRSKKNVATLQEASDDDEFQISSISDDTRPRANKALVTLHVNSRKQKNAVRFQVDTGSECDVLPMKIYKHVTGDTELQKLRQCKKSIVSYTGERHKIAGKASIPVWHSNQKKVLNFNIIDGEYQPILSLDTSIRLGLISLRDCDVLALTTSPQVDLLEEYKDIFGGLGELPGEYKIVTDNSVQPKIHPPRRVPVALRPKIKAKLDELVERKVIVPVTEPTEWVSSMLVVVKPNKIRICLDPRDLNQAIKREHYQMPTIEEVATRLSKAKKFTVLDAKDGFWQKKLDRESSYKTTFNTPFGRYRWLRMPFGISSAPEVWQRTMHEFVEGLHGVEVIADDFVIAGFGDTDEEANKSLEDNERSFFAKCRTWNLKLNKDKVKRAQTTVPFMGHLLTPQGLKADPTKIEALIAMPEPEDVLALKRFLGMVNYLSKFMPHLSDMTEPLRRLEDKDVEWQWLKQHSIAFNTVKKYITETPVLKYYDVEDDVTIQCDASETGLGAVLMQNGQPVSYASRALTDTERRYAQIEKELLAIVWSCKKFDQYIYGRDVVQIESDHEPLQAVFKKSIHQSPKRLQRMRMALQNYSLDIKYKKGRLMFIADTLSRAYRKTTDAAEHDNSEVRALEEVYHEEEVSVAPRRLLEFKKVTAADSEMQQLIAAIKKGWPTCRKACPQELIPYYDSRSELVEDNGLVYRGERLVVPRALRTDMLTEIHRSHVGIGGCLRRAREVLYWPRMNAEVKDYVSKCSICQTFQPEQCREELQPHEMPSRPWSKIGADLFEFGHHQHFLIMVDYWSSYFEVQELKRPTSANVMTAFKVQFARHGIPDVLITDNGTQFTSLEFAKFAETWRFKHDTSSPHYPQSNGKAENAVKVCKALLKKAKADMKDPLLALLDWRNTPSEGLGTSPVQRLMGRRTQTLLPTHPKLLKPEVDTQTEDKLAHRKQMQAERYNKKSQRLPPLQSGAAIRMKLPGDNKWSLGSCVKALPNRSYEVPGSCGSSSTEQASAEDDSRSATTQLLGTRRPTAHESGGRAYRSHPELNITSSQQ